LFYSHDDDGVPLMGLFLIQFSCANRSTKNGTFKIIQNKKLKQ